MGGDILVVDDDEGLRDALELQLADRGWRVRSAADGAEGLRLVREALPMLVLLDLEMPVLNGRRMLQELRRMPLGVDVPVVVLSAFGYEWEAELMGAQGYIRKPVGPAQLDEAIARVLAGARRPAAATLN